MPPCRPSMKPGPTTPWGPGRGRTWWATPCCGRAPGRGISFWTTWGWRPPAATPAWGGEILRLLQGAFRDRKGILVESEAPEGDDRDALRQRRMGFYRRNGFAFLPYTCVLFGVHYAVALCPPAEAGGEAAVMEAHRKSTGPSWPPGPMRSSWRSPGTPSAPPPRQSPGRGRPTSPAWGRGRKDDGAC